MKRWLKLTAGVALTCAGLYVIVGEQMAGVTANAMVNAQVVTVRAPVIKPRVHTSISEISGVVPRCPPRSPPSPPPPRARPG